MGTTSEKLQAALESKEAVQTALEDKGLEVSDDFSTYGNLIGELENTSDSTATADDIVEGTVAYTATGRTVGTYKYTHPTHTARTGVPTANQTPAFGGTFQVTQPVSDGEGHITAMNARTITVPKTEATQSLAGLMSAADKKKLDGVEAGAQVNSITGVKGNAESSYRTGNVNITPANIGAIPTSEKGAASGVAELDSSGKVPSSQLPSYVDDIIEATTMAAFPSTGETGKIYVATATNKTYRWSGSGYTEVSASLALGETSSTAYRGDRGKVAYAHTSLKDNPHETTAEQIPYDNTTSGLTAETVQDSIDELSSTTANFQSGLTADGYPYAIFKESDDTFYQLTFKNNSLELGKTINGTWKTLWSSEPNSFEVSLEPGFTLDNNDITVDGKIVIINFQVNGTFNADTHTKIFTVPEGYRPPCTVYCCGHSGSNGAIQVRMDNDGACYSYNSVWHTSARFTLIYRRS